MTSIRKLVNAGLEGLLPIFFQRCCHPRKAFWIYSLVLFGIDFASLAVNSRTQINLIYAVIHDITADKLDTELVQILSSLNFGHFSLADLIAQTRCLITDFETSLQCEEAKLNAADFSPLVVLTLGLTLVGRTGTSCKLGT